MEGMHAFRLLLAATTVVLAAACGNTVSTKSSSSTGVGGTSTGATSSSSSGIFHADCTTNADCKGDDPCSPITPGGYTVCLSPIPEETSCQMDGGSNQCCTTSDCPSGDGCYAARAVSFCGGALPMYNVCLGDGCTSDADCTSSSGTGAICAPAGAFGYPKRECLIAYCHTDADCTAKAGGACIPIGGNPCCGLVIPDGLGCTYPGDCASGTACPNDALCKLDPSTRAPFCQPFQGCPP
jgi:hypothetical protein